MTISQKSDLATILEAVEIMAPAIDAEMQLNIPAEDRKIVSTGGIAYAAVTALGAAGFVIIPADEIASLTAKVENLTAALMTARAFILDEYGDAESSALDGEPVSRDAREVWSSIHNALADEME